MCNAHACNKGAHTYTHTHIHMHTHTHSHTHVQAYFADGDPCPGDLPKRSFTLDLKCDDKEHMYGGEEPATCVYKATFATPLACKQAELDKVRVARDKWYPASVALTCLDFHGLDVQFSAAQKGCGG